jgi:hypothetical protein
MFGGSPSLGNREKAFDEGEVDTKAGVCLDV